MDASYLKQTYRNYRLRKDTPKLLRTLFVERKGDFSDLSNRYGKDDVEAQYILRYITKNSNGKWELTEKGEEDIITFHARQTPFQFIKSLLFGTLACLFK